MSNFSGKRLWIPSAEFSYILQEDLNTLSSLQVDKSCSRSLSRTFNEPTDSIPALFPSSNIQYAATSDLAKLYNQDIEWKRVGLLVLL